MQGQKLRGSFWEDWKQANRKALMSGFDGVFGLRRTSSGLALSLVFEVDSICVVNATRERSRDSHSCSASCVLGGHFPSF